MSKEIKKVLVVGAGVMGCSMAQVFAASGYETVMSDIKPEALDAAKKRIAANIEGLKQIGLADDSYGEAVEKNLTAILNEQIPAMAKDFDLVAEAVYEAPQVKQEVYKMLAENCREDCIFASDTSAMDVFTVTKDVMTHPERFVIAHWFNPPHLMKLIEIVRSEETSDETVETVKEVMLKCDKKPVVLNKFMPGFIVNRMTVAICREILYMVEQGWVSPQDIETALKYTDGLRWSFEGPLELADFVGLKITTAVSSVVSPSLCNDATPSAYGMKLLSEGKSGVMAGEGLLGKYPDDLEAYIARRNKRIVTMCKVMDQFEKEDKENPIR